MSVFSGLLLRPFPVSASVRKWASLPAEILPSFPALCASLRRLRFCQKVQLPETEWPLHKSTSTFIHEGIKMIAKPMASTWPFTFSVLALFLLAALGETAMSARGQELCTCGCGKLMANCNHVNCPAKAAARAQKSPANVYNPPADFNKLLKQQPQKAPPLSSNPQPSTDPNEFGYQMQFASQAVAAQQKTDSTAADRIRGSGATWRRIVSKSSKANFKCWKQILQCHLAGAKEKSEDRSRY